MKNMEEWFADQDFNTEELPQGHRNRFLDKLDAACEAQREKTIDSKKEISKKGRVIPLVSWTKWALVAGFALLIGLGGYNYTQNLDEFNDGLESVSPEMAQAQDFFTSTITYELQRLNKEQSPQTERIIADAKSGLSQLEKEYQKIKKDFRINQDNKAVIAAMIENFQSRIDLLQEALDQIEQLKKFKEQDNEITI
ncbi:MAG: hypothetical protein WBG46_08970 [Nonlabens sp.]